MCKLGSVNERPHLAGSVSNHDQSWAESGDRFLIRMFRAYLFRQVQDGQSWLELSHIVAALNKVNEIYKEILLMIFVAGCRIGGKSHATISRRAKCDSCDLQRSEESTE